MRIIAMLHLPALPGAPANEMDAAGILGRLLRDAEALAAGGVDALLLENYGDAPFHPRRVPPETVAFMAVLAREVRARFDLPLGVNVLRNDGRAALAVAAAAGGAFIRVNVYTGARLTDQGIVQGAAHRLLRYRRLLGSQVLVLVDVAVKHSAPLAPGGACVKRWRRPWSAAARMPSSSPAPPPEGLPSWRTWRRRPRPPAACRSTPAAASPPRTWPRRCAMRPE